MFRYSLKSLYQAAKSGNAEKLIHILGEYCVICNVLMSACVKEFKDEHLKIWYVFN
jgi:hypothetical protein